MTTNHPALRASCPAVGMSAIFAVVVAGHKFGG